MRPLVRLLAAVLLTAVAAACGGPDSPAGHARGAIAVADAKVGPSDVPTADGLRSAVVDGYSLDDLPTVWQDQRGDTLRLAALAGRVRLVAMVYTSCHATCPLIVADLKQVEAALPAGRLGEVGFVLVSLDPERDTPGRMAEWAGRTGLDPARWTLLSGDAGEVRELAAVLGVRYQPQADGELAHTNAITVLDRTGAVVHQQVGLGARDHGTVAAVQRLLR